MKVGLIGYGVVGKAQEAFFGKENCIIHDPEQGFKNRDLINKECDIAFVCVPTPMDVDGSCDISIVQEAVEWLNTPLIVIRSTVKPGTTGFLSFTYKKHLIFEPEYLGETQLHPYLNLKERKFVILGGARGDTVKVVEILQKFMHPNTKFFQTTSLTAEMCKYMENSFLALKVIFCNEWANLCKFAGVDYNELRELWTADERIGRSHTFVYPDKPGFGGKCLPKDLNAIVTFAKLAGMPLEIIEKTIEINNKMQNPTQTDDGGQIPTDQGDGINTESPVLPGNPS